MQLRLTLSEFALQISEDSEKAGHDFIVMKEKADAESGQNEANLQQPVDKS